MASPEEIARLRRLIGEPNNVAPYDDAYLGSVIDGSGGSVYAAAHGVWTDKAAEYSSLVDITEGGSSRKQSQVFENAQKMAASFEKFTPNAPSSSRASTTRKIVRP